MSLNKIRLDDGTEINISEWVHQPVFSATEFAAASSASVTAFNYVVGGQVSQVGLTARFATEADTNMVKRKAFAMDEAMIVFALTYEAFGLTSNITAGSPALPVVLGDGDGDASNGPAAISTQNLRRLQRDCLVQLNVGNLNKPQIEVPFSYIGQSVGPQMALSGDSGAGTVAAAMGTGGLVTAMNQKKFKLPIYIGGFGENAKPGNAMTFSLKFYSARGAITDLDQAVYIRWYMDGLKRRSG